MRPPATWNAKPSTQNSSSRTISVQSMMSLLLHRKKGASRVPTLLPTSSLRLGRQGERNRRLAGRLPCAGDHRGDGGNRIVEPLLHDRFVRREKRLVIRIVEHVAIADGVAVGLEHGLRELIILQQRVEDEAARIFDGRNGLWRNRELVAVALEQRRLPSGMHAPLLRQLPIVVSDTMQRHVCVSDVMREPRRKQNHVEGSEERRVGKECRSRWS